MGNTLQTSFSDPNTEFEENSFSDVEKGREKDVAISRTNGRIGSDKGTDGTEISPYKEAVKRKTRNEGFEGKKHPVTDVPFVRREVDVGGEHISVVVPEFEKHYKARLPEGMYCVPDQKQFRECNRQLKNELSTNTELRALFSEEQLAQIEREEIPDGYTWHHEVEAGVLVLVNRNIHLKTGHTGGRYFWGGGTANR